MSTATIADVFYPDSDDEPLAETPAHVDAILYLLTAIRARFAGREDVYVAADSYLYYVENKPKFRKAPGIMVALGTHGRGSRRWFKTWEEGVVPSVIFEVTSPSTFENDIEGKSNLYAGLGVSEYYLFDPLSQTWDTPLVALRLVDGEYDKVDQGPDGGVDSPALGMRLVPDGELLRLVDIASGRAMSSPDELVQRVEGAERQVAVERSRADDLAAEVARLKAKYGEV